MLNLEMFDRAKCTREEKSHALSSALALLRLAERARREGILSLEEEIEKLDSAFMRALLRMVVDSIDAEVIRAFGEAMMASSGLSGKDLLDAMVALEGIMLIQEGSNPHIITLMLSAYFGMDADLLTDDAALRPLADSPDETTEEKKRYRYASAESIVADIRDSLRLSDGQINFLRTAAPAINPFTVMQADIVAIAILYLDEADRAKVLESMSPEEQSVVVRTICELSDFDASSYIDLARKSLQRIIEAAESSFKPAGGIAVAAALLGSATANVEHSVLQALEREAPELAADIRQKMFVFEDIMLLDDRSLQKVIREIDTQDIVFALKGASLALQEKIFKNVSTRATQTLKEDMEYLGPVRIARIKEAREKIMTTVRHLEDSGEIVIMRMEEDTID